jgi:group I intron endonuclease
MNTFIYALLDPIEKQEFHIYIGKSDNPYRRFYEHLKDQDGTHKTYWIQSLLKIGYNPDLQILEQCNQNNWEEREKEWIKFYRNIEWNIVNETEGGEGLYNPTKEVRQKISIAHLGKKTWLGKHHSEESKIKIGKSKLNNKNKLGKHWSKEDKIKLSQSHKGQIPWNKGKHNSEEHNRKVSEGLKGHIPWNKGLHFSEELRKKLSEAHKGKDNHQLGRHHSEESKQKMRESHKGKLYVKRSIN